jgi:hypothetical protein
MSNKLKKAGTDVEWLTERLQTDTFIVSRDPHPCAEHSRLELVVKGHRGGLGLRGAWRGRDRLRGRRWYATIGHPMAFGIHTLHIGHVIAPLQRRRVRARLCPGGELLRRIALALPVVLLEVLQGRARARQNQDARAGREGGTGRQEPQDAQ